MGYFREIKKLNLLQRLGLDRCLYELILADDEIRLFGLMLASPFGVVTQVALDSRCRFG